MFQVDLATIHFFDWLFFRIYPLFKKETTIVNCPRPYHSNLIYEIMLGNREQEKIVVKWFKKMRKSITLYK